METNYPGLSFVKCTAQKDGRLKISSWWAPEKTGDYATDCRTGARYGREFREHLRKGDFAFELPWIIRAMPHGSDIGGVEIGFAQAFAEAMSQN